MTGLLTGTNKFKNFEIETNLKISVLNSPYLEGRRYVYKGGENNVTPTPQVGNITIDLGGHHIVTLVPPAKFYAINNTESALTVTDTNNILYGICKQVKVSQMPVYYYLNEDNTWLSPEGQDMPYHDTIDVVDAYEKSPKVNYPEIVSWLEAQGFTIPTE